MHLIINNCIKILAGYTVFFGITTVIFASNMPSDNFSMNTNKIPLIPRKILFGNPEKTSATISPDGRKIAFLAPVKGVLNIWVADSKDLTLAKPITKETKRDIRSYFWSFTNEYLLYIQDQNGNENFHLYRIDLNTGKK